MHSDWTEFGRTFWANGQQAELCGELIDSTTRRSCNLLSASASRPSTCLARSRTGRRDTYYIFGAPYPKDQADQDFQPVHNTLQGQVQSTSYPTLYNLSTAAGKFFDNMTVYDWIENYVPGGHDSQFGTLLNNAYNEEYGAETTDQAALNLIYLLGYNTKPGNFSIYGKSDERYHIVGGNTLLPQAIASALPSESIHLNNRMMSIKTNSDGTITMTFDTGRGPSTTVTADEVILCMSFSVLRTLDYRRAGFDNLKQTAITQLGSGINAKLNVQFNSRIWNSDGSTGSIYTDQPFQSGWDVTRGQAGATGIFVEYPGANVAKSMAQSNPYTTTDTNTQVTKFAQQLLTQMEPIYPGISNQWNKKAMLSTPFTDPNFLCSYSYWKPASTPASAATRRNGWETSTSPASIARRTSRASWRAAHLRAFAPRARSSRT
jgi:monoamine oxidase